MWTCSSLATTLCWLQARNAKIQVSTWHAEDMQLCENLLRIDFFCVALNIITNAPCSCNEYFCHIVWTEINQHGYHTCVAIIRSRASLFAKISQQKKYCCWPYRHCRTTDTKTQEWSGPISHVILIIARSLLRERRESNVESDGCGEDPLNWWAPKWVGQRLPP